MRVLVIGSGGREHALCWKLRNSPSVKEVYCAPGNPGIASTAHLVPIAVDSISELVAFAQEQEIDLTIVGPEYPLTLGIVDEFERAALLIFGPSKQAAALEGSKSFSKEVMVAAGVKTPEYRFFSDLSKAKEYALSQAVPIVLKADGLAAGKGVIIALNREEVEAGFLFLKQDLHATDVVVEEFVTGVEVSFIVATDGKRVVPLALAHDYKRINEGDTGPNTGGMGTVSPTYRLGSSRENEIVKTVIDPVLREMEKRGKPFCGFLYAGLLLSPDGTTFVLEFNARLGDPETQVILRRMTTDLGKLLFDLARKDEKPLSCEFKDDSAVCVVMAAAGYPNHPTHGDEITGLELAQQMPEVQVFHAGTSQKGNKLLTAGGRVLNVTATGKTLDTARANAYKAVDLIQFRGRQVRRDIGAENPSGV